MIFLLVQSPTALYLTVGVFEVCVGSFLNAVILHPQDDGKRTFETGIYRNLWSEYGYSEKRSRKTDWKMLSDYFTEQKRNDFTVKLEMIWDIWKIRETMIAYRGNVLWYDGVRAVG